MIQLSKRALRNSIEATQVNIKQTLRLGSLPDFYIIGAQKSGTSSLYDYLCQHPAIVHRLGKEVHFFNNPSRRKKGLDFYRAHFSTLRERNRLSKALGYRLLEGEATPFSIHPWIPKWVHEATPKAKLIFIVRNPVERAFSHYGHNQRAGREPLSFEDAIACEESRIEQDFQKLLIDPDCSARDYLAFSYLKRGRYDEQLQWWLKYFSRNQIHIVSFEEFVNNQHKVGAQIFDFLQVPVLNIDKTFCSNAKKADSKKLSMPIDLQEKLLAYFHPYNQSFFESIGKTYDWS